MKGAVPTMPLNAARSTFLTLKAAFRTLPREIRGEFVMSLNRLSVGFIMFGVTAASAGSREGDLTFPGWQIAIGSWIVLAAFLSVLLAARPSPSITRRVSAMVLDVAGGSIILHACGPAGAFVYPLYLWIIVGNGVRFGGGYFILASVLSVIGFAVVAATTSFWQEEMRLTVGLMAGLVVLPAYLYSLTRHIASARADAERANRAKTLFLASVSHELRTPLNAIIGMASILYTTRLNRDQAQMVSTIDASADTLLTMIEGLLEISRSETGQLRARPVDFDLARLLAEVDKIIRVQAEAKNLHFNTFLTARAPLDLYGDAARLREILLSLCANAVKFTAEGFITVAVDGTTGKDGRFHLRAEVTDTGIGIPLAAQERIFGMFMQASESITERYGGTGIGLASCDKLVRLLSGQIGVTSELGRGSTFWFTLPMVAKSEAGGTPTLNEPVCVVADDPKAAASLTTRLRAVGIDVQSLARPVGQEASRASVAFVMPSGDPTKASDARGAQVEVLVLTCDQGRLPSTEIRQRYSTTVTLAGADGMLHRAIRIAAARLSSTPTGAIPPAERRSMVMTRVLVADDNAINRRVLTKVLEHAGHQVVTADHGQQACEVLAEKLVDIAFFDVNMPVLNGTDAMHLYFSSTPPEARVPVLALTADGTPETAARCLAAGMAACLVKPVRPPALLKALDEALVAHRRNQMDQERFATSPLASTAPALDLRQLDDLSNIAGEKFIVQLVGDFIQEIERSIVDLRTALQNVNTTQFQTHAHEICSCAANVGARALRELCSPWELISATELEQAGSGLLQCLEIEWARTRGALLERAVRGPSTSPTTDDGRAG